MRPGARLALWGAAKPSGPTARDYVQDGLAAMWDAIENAGWGQHDASATVWRELINSKDTPFAKHTNAAELVVSFGLDHLALAGAVASLSQDDNSFYKALFAANPVTVELIHTADFSAGSTRQQIWSVWQNGSSGFLYCDSGLGGLGRSDYSGNMRLGTDPKTRTFAISGSTKAAYLNGVIFKETENSAATFGNNDRLIGNTYYYNSSNFGYYGRIYSIRVYSRALTAEEIAANYAVDKARFNLP